jgi:hypothetical protein
VVLLLGGIAVEHLNLDSGEVVGHDVARHEDGIGVKVLDVVNGVGVAHLAGERELGYPLGVDIPQDLVAALFVGSRMDGLKDAHRVFVFAEQADFHWVNVFRAVWQAPC